MASSEVVSSVWRPCLFSAIGNRYSNKTKTTLAALARGLSDRHFQRGEGPGDEVGSSQNQPRIPRITLLLYPGPALSFITLHLLVKIISDSGREIVNMQPGSPLHVQCRKKTWHQTSVTTFCSCVTNCAAKTLFSRKFLPRVSKLYFKQWTCY